MKRFAVVMAALATVVMLAPAAHAIKVPFGTSYVLDGQQGFLPGQSQDTGLVGICDNAGLNCTGFRLVESTSDAHFATTDTTVTLRGWVCVFDNSAECSSTGIPFTGIRITERVVDLPEAWASFSASVDLCTWVMAPQDDPTTCLPGPAAIDEVYTPDTGNLAEAIPDSVDLTVQLEG
ncbi:MAG: hypothetical protein M3271_10195 [Actinomycetota bacterium]|nr:hypothetical protein [Actinomycetota bacterium]